MYLPFYFDPINKLLLVSLSMYLSAGRAVKSRLKLAIKKLE